RTRFRMLKDVETSMAKHLSVARKSIVNAGANKSQVRIMGDVIALKLYAKFNELEKMLFQFINHDPVTELKFYEMIYDDVYKDFQPVISMYHPELRIKSMVHRVEHELGYSISVIYLNYDLENLINKRQVTIP
ncbi:MAG: hypothetical protein ACJ8MO_16195, partial [Bacillus sp. (in: firmicutes)]